MPTRFLGHKLRYIYAQPFEAGIALILFLSGALMGLDDRFTPRSVSALEFPWSLLFRLMLIVAGTLLIVSVIRTKRRWTAATEVAGFMLGAAAFATYAAGLAEGLNLLDQDAGYQGQAMGCITYAIMAAVSLVKVRALMLEGKARLRLLRETPIPAMGEEADNG